ncbi:MAG: fibronectin type III domain-containing protein, partial [Actinobacteria bacterium]|nr:fibronectin type III domain-containing protein [Actinomycetota bacterium]
VASPAATNTYTPPPTVPGGCSSTGGDADLVRCAAEWAISQDAGEGNVGNGQNVGATMTAGQVVDVRADTPASTVNLNGSLAANQIPISTIFNTGLTNVNPAVSNGVLIASASQGPGGIVAEGLRMLGYTTAPGGYIHSGVPYYNNTLSVSQGQPNTGTTYTLDPVAPQCAAASNGCNQIYGTQDLGAEMNTTAPAISAIGETLMGTSAKITWTTSQPGTSMVQYGTTSGGPYNTTVRTGCDSGGTPEACTILRGSHSLTITGLTPSQKYYFKVTSYNNGPQGSTSPENSFTAAPPMLPTDYVYYFPWYDSRVAGGWGGNDWICIANPGANPVKADIYVGTTYYGTQQLAAGAYYNWTTPDLMGGPVQVRCEGCQASGDHLTVTDRTLYMGTFHETMAPEHTEASGGTTQLGTAYSWPWYDNANAGFVGDWVMVGNADPTNSATVDVYLGSTLEQTFTIAPRSVANPVQIIPRTDNGPVKVVSTGGQLIFATQRVLYNNSFNEIYGNRITP